MDTLTRKQVFIDRLKEAEQAAIEVLSNDPPELIDLIISLSPEESLEYLKTGEDRTLRADHYRALNKRDRFICARQVLDALKFLHKFKALEEINVWSVADTMFHIGLWYATITGKSLLLSYETMELLHSEKSSLGRKQGHEETKIHHEKLLQSFRDAAHREYRTKKPRNVEALIERILNSQPTLKALTLTTKDEKGYVSKKAEIGRRCLRDIIVKEIKPQYSK